jgi:CHAT domain-containing protein
VQGESICVTISKLLSENFDGYQIQKAGAKNAIASLWSVDDQGTQTLMESFYRELQKGDVTSTEALHRAQLSLIKSSKYNHPNYWSAFFAIGNGL